MIYYKRISKSLFKCELCPHKCEIGIGEHGKCLVRSATNDGIKFNAYGKITSINVEPIEKKPIYHYRPGIKTLSVGGYSCNMFCEYCQNFLVSQRDRSKDSKIISPQNLLNIAIEKECKAICFTYNEPTMYFEYVMDVFDLSSKKDIDIILKTNAYLEKDPWIEICKISNAMNIDWKGNNDKYLSVAGVDGNCIYDRIKNAKELNIHIEISIPIYYNSYVEDFLYIFSFLNNLDDNIPVHLLKIYPCNKITHVEVTSDKILQDIYNLAKQYIRYVYVHGINNNMNTVCNECGKLLVSRIGLKSKIENKCECESLIY